MSITITIEAKSAKELAADVWGLAQSLRLTETGVAVGAPDDAAQPAQTTAKTDESAQAPVAQTQASPAAPAQPETTAADDTPAVDVVDIEVVRARLAELAKAGKQAEVKALLSEFGAVRVSDVAAERRGELLEAAEAIA